MNKYIKIMILSIMLIVLTGCTAEVNIHITNYYIDDTIEIVSTDEENVLQKAYFRKYIPAYEEVSILDEMPDEEESGIEYYDFQKEYLLDRVKYTYKYRYPFENYLEARGIKNAFRSSIIRVDEDKNEIIIYANNMVDKNKVNYPMKLFANYPELETVTINITSEFDIKYSNADRVENGVHTWVFSQMEDIKTIRMILDKGNKKVPEVTTTQALRIKDLDKKEQEKEEKKQKEKTSNVTTVILWVWIGIIIVVLLFIIGSFIFKIIKK